MNRAGREHDRRGAAARRAGRVGGGHHRRNRRKPAASAWIRPALVVLGGLALLGSPPVLAQRVWTVGVSGAAPFGIVDGDSGEGVSVEIWDAVATDLGLEYRLAAQPGTRENLRALVEQRVDVAIGPISITPQRVAVEGIVFSQPFYFSQIGVMLPAKAPGFWHRIAPFRHLAVLSTIGGLLLCLFLVGNLIWLAEKDRNSEQFPPQYLRGVGNGMWFAIVTLTTVGYGDRHPVTAAGRWIAGLWMMITLVAVSSVTAVLASSFTLSLSDGGLGTLRSAADLRGARMAVIRGTTSAAWGERYRARLVPANGLDEAVQLVESGAVEGLIYDVPALKYYLQLHPHRPLRVADFSLATESYGFAFRKGSGLERSIDIALLRLHQDGRIAEISEAWLE